jgi:hypothetical protein
MDKISKYCVHWCTVYVSNEHMEMVCYMEGNEVY